MARRDRCVRLTLEAGFPRLRATPSVPHIPMSSSFGKNLVITLFGESHSAAVGVVLDGFPAGFSPDLTKLQAFLDRRAPGRGAHATARREADVPEFLAGLCDGRTCGTPIAAILRNGDTRSGDYAELRVHPRPGHADYPMAVRTGGANDIRGGGHSSGRLTAGLCVAGGLCLQALESLGVSVRGRIVSIAGAAVGPDVDEAGLDAAAREAIAAARAEGDSVGGVVECVAEGLPPGVGEPMFGGLENRLSQALFGIPAVKGVEFGNGFAAAGLRGSENNDPYVMEDGRVCTSSNRHGGILGGMTTGMPLVTRVAIKPTPSIALEQRTVDLAAGTSAPLRVRGRHDPCIVPRALPAVEAAVAIVLLDALLDAPATFAALRARLPSS